MRQDRKIINQAAYTDTDIVPPGRSPSHLFCLGLWMSMDFHEKEAVRHRGWRNKGGHELLILDLSVYPTTRGFLLDNSLRGFALKLG